MHISTHHDIINIPTLLDSLTNISVNTYVCFSGSIICASVCLTHSNKSLFSPELTWRDVQHLIVNTSELNKLDGNALETTNVAGYSCKFILNTFV